MSDHPAPRPRPGLRAALFGLVVAFALAACERPDPLQTQRLLVFGTVVDLSTWGVAPRDARAAFDAIDTRLRQWHADWHPWQDSPLARANAAFARGEAAALTPELVTLVQHAQAAAQASGGLFDPAIGRLVELWGFHQDTRPAGPPPAPAAIAALVKQHPAMEDLSLDGTRISSRNPAVALDFGGIAKGYAVDRAIEELRGRGVHNALVNAGGNLRAIGTKDGQPWRIGVRNPRGEGVLAALELRGDESVSTSGDYERFFDWQGVRYHHVLDPRSGFPAIGSMAVTVIAASAEQADIASTALMVAGPGEWLGVARRLGVTQVLRIDERGQVHMTPAMAARLHFEVQPAPAVEVTAEP